MPLRKTSKLIEKLDAQHKAQKEEIKTQLMYSQEALLRMNQALQQCATQLTSGQQTIAEAQQATKETISTSQTVQLVVRDLQVADQNRR